MPSSSGPGWLVKVEGSGVPSDTRLADIEFPSEVWEAAGDKSKDSKLRNSTGLGLPQVEDVSPSPSSISKDDTGL
jgi:hypothetical protein